MSEIGNRNKVFRGIGSQGSIVAIQAALEVVYFAIMSRLLTPDEFGYLAVIMAVTFIIQSISEAGLGSAIIQRKDPDSRFISTAFTLSFSMGGLFALCFYLCAPMMSNFVHQSVDLTNAFRIISVTVLLNSINSIARAMYMRQLRFMRFGMYQITAYIISSVLAVCLALKGYGLYAVIWASVANVALTTVIMYVICGFHPSFQFDKRYARDVFSFGGWLTMASLVRSISEQIDKLILSRFLPIKDVGSFSRPSGFISTISTKVYGIFDTILFPILSSINGDSEKVETAYSKCVFLVMQFSMMLMCVLVLGAHFILSVVFGDQWTSLTFVFQVLSISVFFSAYTRITDCFFRSLGYVRVYFRTRYLMLFITGLGIWIGTFYGLHGVAIAYTLTKLIECLIRWFYLQRIVTVKSSVFIRHIITALSVPTIAMVIGVVVLKYCSFYPSLLSVIVFSLICIGCMFFAPHLFGEHFKADVYDALRCKLRNK